MTLLEYNTWMNKLSQEFAKKGLTKRSDIRKFLKDNDYSKTSRAFISSYSGGGKSTKTDITMSKTIDRLSKKTKLNQKLLKNRISEINKGDYTKTLKSFKSYTNELRRRAKTISDPAELAKTKAELKRMITVNKSIRTAKVDELPKIMEQSVKTLNNIQFQKTIRSSASSQVKTVARTERTRVRSKNFYESTVSDSKDDTLFDVVLSSLHVVFDECDIVAQNGPYTKESLPTLPLHPNCMCRYHRHNSRSTKRNKKNGATGTASDSVIERADNANNNKARDSF